MTTHLSIRQTPFIFITDRNRSKGRSNTDVIRDVLKGGVRWIQYRDLELNDADFYTECLKVREICSEVGAGLIVNKRLDIAKLVQADGIHLGSGSLPTRVVREYMGEDFVIGYSAHTMTEAVTAIWEGATYISLSPIFRLTHKKSPFEPHGIMGAKGIIDKVKAPVFLLGGIKFDDLSELVGVIRPLRITAVSMLSEADDIATTAENMMEILEPAFKRDTE